MCIRDRADTGRWLAARSRCRPRRVKGSISPMISWWVSGGAGIGAGRLVFKPPVAQDQADAPPALQEALHLDCLDAGIYRLTRRLRRTDALQASLQVDGTDLALLLQRVEGVPHTQHFTDGPGYTVTRNYTLDTIEPAAALRLAEGSAHVDGLRLTLTVPTRRGVAGDLVLEPTGHDSRVLPEDLLAVLGWDWARLIRERRSWSSKMRLRAASPRCTQRAEAALNRAAAHLAQTVAEPPWRYHERLRTARWHVFFRRSIPAMTALTLLLSVALMSDAIRRGVQEAPGVWTLLFHLPTALFALSFCLQELPRFEIPPWPRRLDAASWWQEADAATAAADPAR